MNIFVSNCKTLYSPHAYCTIGEQLVGFRGLCPFKIYMPQKPSKYGMMIVMVNDAKIYYMISAEVYIGAVQKQVDESVPEYYVRKLSEPLHGTNRNLTMDNWFTSVPIADRMLTSYKLTILGLPPSFISKKPVGTCLYGFDQKKTLLSYTPKKNKVVILLSTMHRHITTDDETAKPQMVVMYNMTKGGTDMFDQLCNTYSVARQTRRWPLRLWFALMDQAMILYRLANPNCKGPKAALFQI